MSDDVSIASDTVAPQSPPLPTAPVAGPKPWGFWSTLLWTILAILVMSITQVLVGLILGLNVASDSLDIDGTFISVAGSIVAPFVVVFVALLCKLRRGWTPATYLALVPISVRTVLRWCLIMVVCNACFDTLMVVTGRPIVPQTMIDTYATAQSKLLFWIFIVTGPAVVEEIIFRGFLFRGWAASRLGVYGTIVLSAIFFGSLHLQYDVAGMTGTIMIGAVLGLARARTGSLYAPIAMHACTNLVATIQTAVAFFRIGETV